jgi:hypothetical protein
VTSTSSVRERLLLAARREAEARVDAEMRAVDNEELREQVQQLQWQVEAERAAREELEHRLTVGPYLDRQNNAAACWGHLACTLNAGHVSSVHLR